MDKVMESKRLLTDMVGMVSSGVFAVIDDPGKRVFISCSNNVLKGIAGVVTKMKDEDHVCSHMSNPVVSVLYLGPNPRFEGSKLIQKFETEGYEVLNRVTPVRLTGKVRVLYMDSGPVAVVTLRSARGNERIVGAFDEMADCEVWFEEHYPNGYVDQIVELGDELTQKVRAYCGE